MDGRRQRRPLHPAWLEYRGGLAADLQLASACRNTEMVEYLTGSPFIDDLVERPWKLDSEGMIEVPGTPGLGISVNMDAVKKYAGRGLEA
jgi:D-galactarolactone cycloisomerase